ncbi:cyclin-like protein [Nitzschia inconspicua]|uniref:Cyclin-like protein n=1 Tax=Nitzschia inconspicua TaxID=303405 RepID=A0A9K3LGH2_9STRA|nr:cyclin-like protein [Nitzschia inconspicua]
MSSRSTSDNRQRRRSLRLQTTMEDEAPINHDNERDTVVGAPQRSSKHGEVARTTNRRSSRNAKQNNPTPRRSRRTGIKRKQVGSSTKASPTSRSSTTNVAATSTANSKRKHSALQVSTNQQNQPSVKKSKTVTPSPAAANAASFGFTTPRLRGRRSLSTRSRSGQQELLSKAVLPPGVVDLYPPNCPSSLECFCDNCNGNAQNCSWASLTSDYIRVYGHEHWNILRRLEWPVFGACQPSRYNWTTSADNNSSPSSTSDVELESNQVDHNDTVVEDDADEDDHSHASVASPTSQRVPVTPLQGHNYVDRNIWYQAQRPDQHHSPTKKLFPQQDLPKESSAFLKELHQPELTPKMRAILVDWMIELSEHFQFGPDTLHLAITLADRVLASGPLSEEGALAADDELCDREEDEDESRNQENDNELISLGTKCYRIRRSRYQLLGGTCTWIACKLLETNPPKAKDIAYVSDGFYSVSQVKSMERRICNALQFAFFQEPTPYQFLLEFLRASHEGDLVDSDQEPCSHSFCGIQPVTHSKLTNMANYLLELGRMPFSPTTHKPSLLAAASVYLARSALNLRSKRPDPSCDLEGVWTPSLEYYSGYSKEDLKETVSVLHAYHMAAESLTNLKATFVKYRMRKYQSVAYHTVVPMM